MKTRRSALQILVITVFLIGNAFASDPIDDAINDVLAVEKNGQGNAAASKAMQTLQNATHADIPRLLEAMDKANQISANWLRGAIVSITQREGELPVDPIKGYFVDATHSQLGRLMAFELLSNNDSTFAEKTIPTLVDDSSLPLRRMGIQWHIDQAESAENPTEKLGLLALALDKARDVEQVIEISELIGEHGVSIDLQKQLGFVNQWHIVGNFDNKDEGGFDVLYGPENDLANIDLENDSYLDVEGNSVKWFSESTVDPTGLVDLVEAIGPVKGVTAYAYAVFDATEAREVDIRVGCINAHKVWVNGELTISNEVYHNGISLDKFAGQAKLNEGKNVILVKICQNEQSEPWAQQWRFQLRVCDETGKAIAPVKQEESEE